MVCPTAVTRQDPNPDTDRAAPFAEHTLERWAYEYVRAPLAEKRTLGPTPELTDPNARSRRDVRPTRGAPLTVVTRADKLATHPEALASAKKRAAVLHAFAHHELQAAELFCWAILAFVDAPAPFRRGLAKIARDEARHFDLYLSRVEALGSQWGDFAVRDWFWQRLPECERPAQFVATMGLGFEGANLDHGQRFESLFRSAGDAESAALVRLVSDEERSHVAFARHWFERFTGGCDADAWRAHLVAPLSPLVMRGPTIDRAARLDASMPEALIDAIEQYRP